MALFDKTPSAVMPFKPAPEPDTAIDSPAPPYTVGVWIWPNSSLLILLSITEVLRAANVLAGTELFKSVILSRDGQDVLASNGMKISVDAGLNAPPPMQMLLLIGGFGADCWWDNTIARSLRHAARFTSIVGAIDFAPFLLARAGLLDGYRATVHWWALESLKDSFPEVNVESSLFVADRDRWTCSGARATMDMMLWLVETRHGAAMAEAIADWFTHGARRSATESQTEAIKREINITHSTVRSIIERMREHIDEPISIEVLAGEANLSVRQVERLFRLYTGLTPKRYFLELRLRRAQALLRYSQQSVVEVAVACGFASASHFSKTYTSWFGRRPSLDRDGQTTPGTDNLDVPVSADRDRSSSLLRHPA